MPYPLSRLLPVAAALLALVVVIARRQWRALLFLRRCRARRFRLPHRRSFVRDGNGRDFGLRLDGRCWRWIVARLQRSRDRGRTRRRFAGRDA